MGAVVAVAGLGILALAAAGVRVAPVLWLLWQPRSPRIPVLPVDLSPPAAEMAPPTRTRSGLGWPDPAVVAAQRARARRWPWLGTS